MSKEAKQLSGADIDAALENIKLQKSVGDTVTPEKGMTVDKRAQGGATKTEDDESDCGVGRKQKDVKNPELGLHPASKRSGNFATKFKEGNGLADSKKDDGVNKNPSPNRGLSKAVKEDKSAESSKSSKSSASSAKSVKKALPPQFVKKDGDKSAESSKSSKSSVKKAMDGSCSSAASVEKAVAPAEESSASNGSESGAPRLGKVVNKSMTKAVELLASAKKHLTKAFEDGSDTDLDKTASRLISAKDVILKAVEAGEKISPEVLERVNKAGGYFAKALETYEKEDVDGHIAAVGKTQKHLGKAISAHQTFEKSLSTEEIKKPSGELHFAKNGDKVVLEMTEDQAKQVRKSLEKDNLYKSLGSTLPVELKKTVDATPVLRDLFKSLVESNDSLRDTLADKSEKDREFRKSVEDAIVTIGQVAKQAHEGVEKLLGTPNMRKSIVSVVESPKSESGTAAVGTMDRMTMEATLEKGLKANLISMQDFMAWDVDKVMDELPEKYVTMCKSIQAHLR